MPEEDSITKRDITNSSIYVVDGGALLHRVRWSKGMKFSVIAETYVKYLRRNYHKNTTIVFDGYNDKSTKDHEHVRRSSVPQSSNVSISADNHVPFTQDDTDIAVMLVHHWVAEMK